MRRPLVILVLLAVLATIQGCASIGLENPFSSDPLTGGTDAPTSQLLGVPAPAGMQRYASHGFQSVGPGGGRQGLEVLRVLNGERPVICMSAAIRDWGSARYAEVRASAISSLSLLLGEAGFRPPPSRGRSFSRYPRTFSSIPAASVPR